ncbi:hypothetical protein BY996DRAFT_4583425 [Phakopsora pachyrhizi]|nr:hypothetical protein BY996DRAFT_4583425 [Phakopsora pachyrhizi]
MSQPLLDWSGSLISRQATSRSSLSSLPINFNPLTHSSTVGTTASLAITSTSSPSPTLNLTSTHSSPSNQNLDPTLTSQTPTRSSSRRRPISSLYKIGGSLHSMLSKPQNHSPPQSSINDSQQAQLSKSQTQTSSSSQDQALSIPVTSAQLSSNYYPSTTLTDPIILDSSELEDGPLFRATLLGLERRAHQLKKSLKSLIRGFEKMHLGITTSLEAYDRMEEALRLVDDLSPAAFRPLNQCYYQSAHVTFGKIDKERIERLELHTIGPLKKLSQGFKTLETFKKNFEYECKTYDEFMRQYLSTKFDEEIDLKRARQMKIRFTFARKYYHHKLYELTILYETKVLDILSENMKFEHLSRHLTRELDQLGQQLDLFYVEVKKNRAKIEQQIQCSQDNLKSLERQLKLVTEELESHRFEGAGFGSGYHHLIRSSTSYRSTPGSQRYPTSFPPVMGNQSHNKSHDFGEKLIGFALSIAGRASDGSNLNRTDETIPQKSNFPAISPIKTSAPDIVPSFQLKTSEAYLTQKDQLETNLSEAFKEPIQKKEGFLLSCTKNYTASSSKRRTSFSIHSPTSSQFKRHDTSFKSRPTTSSGGGGSQNHISGQSSSHDSGNRNWKKVWCVLALGEFREYSGESYLTETSRSKIDLRFAMVRERGGRDDRKFSFEIVTSQFVRIYQASNHEEMKEWISAIESCIESLLNGSVLFSHYSNRDIKNRSALKPSKKKRTIDTSKRLSGQFSLLPSEQVIRPSAKLINKSGSDSSALEFMNIRRDSDIGQTERKPRPNSIGLKTVDSEAKNKKQEAEKSDEEEYETVEGENEEGDDDEDDGDDFDQEEEKRIRLKLALVEELDRLAKSSKCAECGRPNPRWASYNLGILICIRCSGIHRSLGSHISKVRSIDLDDWSEEQVKNIREIGNLKSKSIWEFKLMKDKTSETVGKGKEEEK